MLESGNTLSQRAMSLRCQMLLVVIAVLHTPAAVGQLTPLVLFNRCYSHLTQKKLPLKHPLRAQVIAETLSPIEACLQVLDGAKLSPKGDREGHLENDTVEARAVLRAVNDHHRNWFPNDDLVQSSPQCGERCPFADFLHDAGESALHLTRTLLTEGIPFSEIVTGDNAMEALRSEGAKLNISQPDHRIFVSNSITSGFDDTPIPIDTELPQFGELLGIRRMSLNPKKFNTRIKSNTSYSRPKEFFYNRSLGGGVIGTSSYLLLNFGRPDTSPMNGGLALPRVWAKSVMHDLLCREIPMIQIQDARPYVKDPHKDTPAFRTSASCMQCHATVDSVAGVARNLVYTYAPGIFETTHGGQSATPHIYSYDPELPAETETPDLDPQFYKRPPNGRLYYRDYQDRLVNQPIIGIDGLGKALAKSDDLYLCAASRYLHYFTGIKVDIEHSELAISNPHRKEVVKWGLELKKHQSLRTLVKQILESDVYQKQK